MQISHIRISNILGIDELEFSPSGFTKIAGRNGTGKTSVLEAIKAAIKGGHDATLLRNGAEKGEVVLILDDGTEVQKRITATNSTTSVKKDGRAVTKPQAAIQALTDALSVNPIEFLSAPQKDRVRVLLESMPLQVDVPRLSQIVGFEVKAPAGMHALHLIDQVHKQVYEARTGTNRAVREKQGTINQLRAALPPEGTGVEGDETSMQTRLDEVNAALEAEKNRIEVKLGGLRVATAETIATLRADAQAKIDAIKLQLETDVEAQRANLATVEGLAGKQKQKAIDKHATDANPLQVALQRIRDDRDSYARRQQTIDTIGVLETELEGLEGEAASQTRALEGIEAFKLELLNSLPIQGLQVQEGELFCDGVPFDRLNTAKQVDIAVEIAKIRAGELGVICVDRIEALDSDTFEEFRQRAAASDLQLFVTRVADEDFSVQSES